MNENDKNQWGMVTGQSDKTKEDVRKIELEKKQDQQKKDEKQEPKK